MSGGSVGSVIGQAELSSPGDALPPHAGPEEDMKLKWVEQCNIQQSSIDIFFIEEQCGNYLLSYKSGFLQQPTSKDRDAF